MINAQPQEEKIVITNDVVTHTLQENIALYDKDGEQHYDIISAFIKSIRGSDPNAAVYWLARMLEGGEDIKFIARRMLISASEDIGLANPNALLLAQSCFNAISVINCSEGTPIFLAISLKRLASVSEGITILIPFLAIDCVLLIKFSTFFYSF